SDSVPLPQDISDLRGRWQFRGAPDTETFLLPENHSTRGIPFHAPTGRKYKRTWNSCSNSSALRVASRTSSAASPRATSRKPTAPRWNFACTDEMRWRCEWSRPSAMRRIEASRPASRLSELLRAPYDG